MMDDDTYLLKLFGAGWSIERISKRASLAPEVVEQRIRSLVALQESLIESGHADLLKVCVTAGNQYQLIGQTLNTIQKAIDNSASTLELEKLILSMEGQSALSIAEKILKNFIVLNRFTSPDK